MLFDILTRMPALSRAEWSAAGPVAQWLVLVRGAVLAMTLASAAIATLLAMATGPVPPLHVLLLIVGLTTAHATNNLINDWVDWRQGVDDDNYFRTRYGTHALMLSFVSERGFLAITLGTGAVAAACGLLLTFLVGIEVLALMLVGAVFVLFYTWPLKHIGLGEISVLLVWGPLMIGGGFFVLTGTLTPDVIAISLAYGIAPTLVIFGKHIDKAAQDSALGIRTLPVLIGESNARALSLLMLGGLWGAVIVLSITSAAGYWLLATLLSLPAAWRLCIALLAPLPPARPEHYPASIWPLWFSAHGFAFARSFGGWLMLALLIRLPWS